MADEKIPVDATINSRKRHISTVLKTDWGQQMFKQTWYQASLAFGLNVDKIMLESNYTGD